MMNWALKQYVKVKTKLDNQKGSQSLEWIAIAGVVVVLTGIIGSAVGDNSVKEAVKTAFVNMIKKVTGQE